MLNMSRRGVLASVAVAACFGLSKRLEFVGLAHAETSLEPTNGVYKTRSVTLQPARDAGNWVSATLAPGFNAQPRRPATAILRPNSPMRVSQVRKGSLGSTVQEVLD